MSEVNDISRRRVADFFACAAQGKVRENNETQQTRQDIRPATSQRPEEKKAASPE